MKKQKDQEIDPVEAGNNTASQVPMIVPGAEAEDAGDDDLIIVTAPDPDYDEDYAGESGQGRKTIDLDAGLDLQSVMRAADASLRKKTSAPAVSTNGAAEPHAEVAAPPAEPTPVSEAAETALRAQLEQERNNTLRAMADLHNFRRRVDEERNRLVLDANERLIREILPLVDDFERSLGAARQAESYEQLVEGVEAVLRKIGDVLARQGLEPIEALGRPFDPTVHEAVMVEEGSEEPDETVIEELRRGYKMNGRVLRPSLVKVAKS